MCKCFIDVNDLLCVPWPNLDILLALEIFRDSEWVDDLNSVLALFLLSYIFNDIGPLKGLGPELDMKLKHIEKNN